jgi:hypothetical protein
VEYLTPACDRGRKPNELMTNDLITFLSFLEFARMKGIIPNRAAAKKYAEWISANVLCDESDLVEAGKKQEP